MINIIIRCTAICPDILLSYRLCCMLNNSPHAHSHDCTEWWNFTAEKQCWIPAGVVSAAGRCAAADRTERWGGGFEVANCTAVSLCNYRPASPFILFCVPPGALLQNCSGLHGQWHSHLGSFPAPGGAGGLWACWLTSGSLICHSFRGNGLKMLFACHRAAVRFHYPYLIIPLMGYWCSYSWATCYHPSFTFWEVSASMSAH